MRSRPAANQGDFLAVLALRDFGQAIDDRIFVVCGDPLESANGHRLFFNSAATAGGFAGAIAGASENAREHIGLPVDHVSVVVTLLGNQSNIFRDRCMRGTRVLAIDDLVEILRVTDISWFHFAHFARSLTKPPK